MIGRLALLSTCSACFYVHGEIGAKTPAKGELDKGAQVRFNGLWGAGTGYVGHKGGAFGGVAIEHIPAGENHLGIGGMGVAAASVTPWLQGFARISITKAIGDSESECTPKICGTSFGLALGAHLARIIGPRLIVDDGPDHVKDAPDVFGAGIALTYQRVDLDGALGHYIGLTLSVVGGGAMTTSRAY